MHLAPRPWTSARESTLAQNPPSTMGAPQNQRPMTPATDDRRVAEVTLGGNHEPVTQPAFGDSRTFGLDPRSGAVARTLPAAEIDPSASFSPMDVVALTEDSIDDFGRLLQDQPSAGCWCMWFIRPVAEYHTAGDSGNRAAFTELVRSATTPMGLLAYHEEEVAGWCAVGPRDRYVRALKTPTLRQRDRTEDGSVWLVPCFLVRRDLRRTGVATALLQRAVDLAAGAGAVAIEGFPLSGSRTRSKGSDFMTGTETLFASCGFNPVHRPSGNRVIMRRDLD